MLDKLNDVCIIPTTPDEFIELQKLFITLGGEWLFQEKSLMEWPLRSDKAVVLETEPSLYMYVVGLDTINKYKNRRIVSITNVLLTLRALTNIKE